VTPKPASGRAGHGPWRAWLRDRPITLAIIPVIVLLVVGISVMSDYSARVNSQLERLQTAQSDNTTWIISQLEVDILRLRTALAEAMAVPSGGDDGEELAAVRRTFDITYSRVTVIEGSEFQLETTGDARLAEAWAWLTGFMRDHAEVIDQPDAALRADLPALREELAERQDLVRYYAVTGLQEMIRRSNGERLGLKNLLSNFSLIAVIMILLLAGIVWVLALLHRSLEQRAKMSERAISNLRTMIEASLDAVIVIDTDGRVTHFNSAAVTIFGYTRDEALGRDMGEMCLPERFRQDHRRGMERYLATGSGAVANKGRVMLTAQRRDGREFPVEAAIVSDRNADGDPIFIGFVRDVSDRVRIENTLRQARDDAMQSARAKSRFLAVMSHEMRTPLNGVIAALDVIERTTRLSAKQAQFLQIARSCSGTALEQIGDVLELTRMEDGQSVDRAVAFDLDRLLGEIVAQSRPLARARGNELSYILDAGLQGRQLDGYRRLLSRVLMNLIGNAIKFTENGRVTLRGRIEAEEDGDDLLVRFEVTDTGVGIPFDKQTRIFANFETLDDSYSRTAEGSGLGLGIARRAVESMGGEIGVVSSLGKGSTFWFTARFRVVAGVAEPAPSPEPAAEHRPARRRAGADPGPRLDVLVAEDNEVNRIVLREMLQSLGHRPVMAENGRRAVQIAGETRFDVILMDISMPEMDGLEASERIRTSGGPSAQAALVAVTAHALKEDIAEFASHGLATVLTKPVTFDQLTRTLAGVTGGDPSAEGPAPPPAAASVLDRAVLDEAREMLGPEGFASLAQRFLTETEDRVAAILDQIDRDVAEGLPETIHLVAGSGAVMGGADLAALMRRLERLARAEGAAALAPHAGEIAAVWQATKREIAAAASAANPG